jgi:hypothetical protein
VFGPAAHTANHLSCINPSVGDVGWSSSGLARHNYCRSSDFTFHWIALRVKIFEICIDRSALIVDVCCELNFSGARVLWGTQRRKSEAKASLMLFLFVIFELYYILCLWSALPIVLHRLVGHELIANIWLN